jgi:hypothetical protein
VTRRGGWLVVLIAVAALVAVWRVLPTGSPPLYDGICVADPYESLGGSPAPAPVSKTFPADGSFPASEIFTGESPPQAQLLMQAGSFDNTATLTMSITAVQPPSVKPPNGTIEGNVYRFSVLSSAGAELQPNAQLPVFIVLRGTTSVPAPTIDRFDGTSWTPLSTVNAGCGNTFEAQSDRLGEFAAVARSGGTPAPSTSSSGMPAVAVIGALVVLLLLAIVVLFSLDRSRGRSRR